LFFDFGMLYIDDLMLGESCAGGLVLPIALAGLVFRKRRKK